VRRRNEEGFVLIGAIWLLVLCASIAAILTLRARHQYVAASAEERQLRNTLLLDAALETVTADILLKGRSSAWALLPAEGRISIGGKDVQVRITSEAGRLDVNEADEALLGRAFQGLGVDPADRTRIVARLIARRLAKKPVTSWDDLHFVLAGRSGAAALPCLEDELTMYSGLPVPDPASMPEGLNRALGKAAGDRPRAPLASGTPLRLEFSLPSRAALTAWVRVTGLGEQPYSTLGFQRRPVCG
jgi:general secretion pathway protein K